MLAPFMRWLTPAALCAAACAAAAQTPPPAPRRADPLDASASVPAIVHESSLRRYRRAVDDPVIPWREANDTAARIGGWRSYARLAQQPASSASAPGAAQPVPAPQDLPKPSGHRGRETP